MTRDQLFALPVGTRLLSQNETVLTVVGRVNKSMIFQFMTNQETPDIEDFVELLEVIPGELDASEVVE